MIRAFLMRLAGAAVMALMATLLIAFRPATAATLKPTAVVTTDLVTLGDLFDGAGALADKAVFRAPDAGVDGALAADAAVAAARAAGLAVEPAPFATVRVLRSSTEIPEESVLDLVREAVAARLKTRPEALEVTLDGLVGTIVADASATTPVAVSALALQAGSGRFTARLTVDVGAEIRVVDLAGRAVETTEVVILKRPVERRQVIQAADVAIERVDRRRALRAGGLALEDVVGMAATRALRAGDTVAVSDVEPPRLVARGELVTLTYERPGMSLTARGRALADGTLGATVTVLNEQSRRTVEGVVAAGGLVRVAPSPSSAVTAALTQ